MSLFLCRSIFHLTTQTAAREARPTDLPCYMVRDNY